MSPDRAPEEQQAIAASATSIAVDGLVRHPRSFSVEDLTTLGAGTRPAIVDLLSVVQLDHRAELLMSVDHTGRSLVLPMREVLTRHRARLVIEWVPGWARTAQTGLVRLDVDGWTSTDEPMWISRLKAITFEEFVARPRTAAIPWQNANIAANPTDPNELMKRVQSGDRAAFSDLYDALAPQVFGVIKRVLRDPAMSEEVSQEVFVEIWTTAARFDAGRASVNTWAITMARRRAVDRVRREQSQRNRLAELQQQPADRPEQPDASVLTAFANDEVTAALATLPDDQREVIELAFLEGLAHGAIATRLDLPLGTVKGRVRGGLKRLRSIMETHEIGASG